MPFYFFEHFDHEAAVTWQVLRSEFDQMLLDNAREKGAEVREETTVRELMRENGAVSGVRAVAKERRDCSNSARRSPSTPPAAMRSR